MFAVGSFEIEPYGRRLSLLVERSDSKTGGRFSKFQPGDGHVRLLAAARRHQEEIEVPKLIGDVSDRFAIGRYGGGKLVARRVGESDGIAPGPGDAIEVAIALAVNDDRGVDCARSVRQGRDGLKLGYVSKPVGGERKLHNDGFGRGGNRPDLWRAEVLRSICTLLKRCPA